MLSKRGYNPVQAETKKKKKREQNKLREERARRYEEKLSHRNVGQLERQISELTALEGSQGLNAHDKQILQNLQKDLAVIRKKNIHGHSVGRIESEKTKEEERKFKPRRPFIPKNPKKSAYYDPVFNPYGVPPPGMPYREKEEESSETDESVIDIPMPEGEYPFVEKKKKDKNKVRNIGRRRDEPPSTAATPINEPSNTAEAEDSHKAEAQIEDVVTEYSAQPIVRDLRKEATQFLPAAVRSQKRKSREDESAVAQNHAEKKQNQDPDNEMNLSPYLY
ncbi:ww domain binding protein 11 [Schizosaccharomyces cryophilus OY26]|uniref:Ww domain binding protein 11 n=1 Tax=Schizosaccharomyces cryophilus (strain OY26 / ATCC MYA-4695 / CBS 11777 / NBRC 106824 / NRRL Y48691) TaxID=653667 RepID=S9W1U5_SCHCR|nr:ww domain binding protein 11 [Schizosaccharomyces cryophilus OY26]EPY52000.1 ww domain binding protein 11 [Schizosaccharomyces cryophilus OY26]